MWKIPVSIGRIHTALHHGEDSSIWMVRTKLLVTISDVFQNHVTTCKDHWIPRRNFGLGGNLGEEKGWFQQVMWGLRPHVYVNKHRTNEQHNIRNKEANTCA